MHSRPLIPALLLFLALGLIESAPISAQAASFLVDDAIDLVRVSDPQLSPDGAHVLFARAELNWDENERESRLWFANADGSDPRPYTSEEGDGRARWSPDGRWISFVRAVGESEKTRQVFLIRTDGGEALQITKHPTSVSSYEWLPDSRGIVFVASDSLTEEAREEREKGDDAVFVDEGPNGQTRAEWTNLWRARVPLNPGLEPVRADPMTRGDRRIGSFAVSPAGDAVAFTFRTENHRNDGFRSEIAVVALGTAASAPPSDELPEPRQLTHNEAPESQIAWSPDGSRITFVAPDLDRWELAQGNLYVLELGSGEIRRLAENFNGQIRGHEWAPDGRSIDLVALERTDANLYRLDLDRDRVRRLSDLGGVVGSASWSREDRSKVAFVLSTPTSPGDIQISTYPEVSPLAVTDANPDLRSRALADPELVRWRSADGLEIEGLLYLPPERTGAGAMVLEIHGGPAGVFTRGFSSGAQVMAAHGYAVLQPNVRGSTGYGDDLLRGNMEDIGGGDYEDVIAGVHQMIERGYAHPDSLAVKGWSYGGILGGWTLTRTDRFKAASLGAMVADWRSEFGAGFNFDVVRWYLGGDPWSNRDFWIERSSYTHLDRIETPTILFHGDEDETDTVEQTLNFYAGLRYHGVPARAIRFPRAGHGLNEPRHQRTRLVEELRWFQEHVRGDSEWQASERPAPAEVAGDEGGGDPATLSPRDL